MFLEEKATVLKEELDFVEELHRKYPTTLSESYQKDAGYAHRARKIAEMLDLKKNEIDAFLFFHPEYTGVFE